MPKTHPPAVQKFALTLRDKLIPWSQSAAPLLLFDGPPRTSIPLEIRVSQQAPLPAATVSPRYPFRKKWPSLYLNAIDVPVLGCILEGEADYRVRAPQTAPESEWIVPVKQGTFFAVAPETAFSGGDRVAWERPFPEKAFARGLVMQLRRDGIACYLYTCSQNRIWMHPQVFVYETESWLLGEKLIAEMRLMRDAAQPVASLYCQLVLRLLMRAVAEQKYTLMHTDPLEATQEEPAAQPIYSPEAVGIAEKYIQSQLSNAQLTPALVARRIGYSQRHLNRLFQNEMQLSVSHYIQRCRVERAREMLSHDGMKIHEVAAYCGFAHLSVFSAWFARQQGCTPSHYRRQHRKCFGEDS